MEIIVEGDLSIDGHQLLAQPGLIGKHSEFFPDLRLGYFFDVFEEFLERTKRCNQSGSGFQADSRNTGNIVYGVTRQSQEIHKLLWLYPEAVLHLHSAKGLVLHGVKGGDIAANQLKDILVSRNDSDWMSLP